MASILVDLDDDHAVPKHKRQVGSLTTKPTASNERIVCRRWHDIGTQFGEKQFADHDFGAIGHLFVTGRALLDLRTRTLVTNVFFCAEMTKLFLVQDVFEWHAQVAIKSQLAMSTVVANGTLILALAMLASLAHVAMVLACIVFAACTLLLVFFETLFRT